MPRRLKELAEFKTVRDLILNDYVEYTEKTAFIQNTYDSESGEMKPHAITYERFYNDVKALGTFITREVFLSGENEKASSADGEEGEVIRRKANIAIMGDNSYFCALASLTVMCGIGTALPLGRSTSDEKIREIISDLDIKYAFVHPSYAGRIPEGVKIYSLDPDSMERYISLGTDDQDATDLFLTSPISDAYDICLALSTNGERGRRKFARLTNKNISLAIISLQKKVKITHTDRFVSILPLALYSEFILGLLFPLSRGASVIYGNVSPDDPSAILREHKPTMLVSTPSFISDVYSALWSNLQKNGNEQAAMDFIRMVENAGQVRRGIKQNVFSDVTEMLGGELKTILSVSDSLSVRARSGMKAFGIPIVDVYGMAECPVISIKLSASDSDKSLGDPTPFVSISINSAEHDGIGTIRIKGEAVAKGYCNERHNKKYVLRDNWINTGDIGTLTSDGRVHLVGKRTTAFESQKPGRMIYPEQLESALCSEYNIADALIYCEKATGEDGTDEVIICAKVRPEPSYIDLHGPVAAKKMVRDAVEKINSILLPYKRIGKYTVTFEKLKRTPAYRLDRWN